MTGVAAQSGCPTAQLRLTFVRGQGAAGTAYLIYGLANVGSHPCSMYGYPGFAILDAGGRVVQHPARRGLQVSPPERLVTLRTGQRATFTVTSSDVIPSPGCPHIWRGTTVQVYPPGQRAALRLARPSLFCNLRVGPVQRPT